jgi:thiol:disulfide interchange protein
VKQPKKINLFVRIINLICILLKYLLIGIFIKIPCHIVRRNQEIIYVNTKTKEGQPFYVWLILIFGLSLIIFITGGAVLGHNLGWGVMI